jgi:exopolyphosphatase/guanosine-5'-triphosphate,3'-diphosphate pyrophosphatase
MSKHYAILSIGTNSTRVLLADIAPDVPRVELTRSIGTRIGEGLRERGMLGNEPMERTLEALRLHLRAVRGHYVRLFAVATSAVRRAENGAAFSERVRQLTGAQLHILTGDEEATASYRGALTALAPLRGHPVGVVDTGGGSSEYAIGSGTMPERTVSCEIGAVRLTEAVPQLAGRDGIADLDTIERARDIARDALWPIGGFDRVKQLAFVGGSAMTAAAVVRGKKAKVETFELTRSDLQRTLLTLCALPLEERRSIEGMKPQRADILPAGIIVLETVLDLAGHDRAVATSADLLLGYLLLQRDKEPSAGRSGFGKGLIAHERSVDPSAY